MFDRYDIIDEEDVKAAKRKFDSARKLCYSDPAGPPSTANCSASWQQKGRSKFEWPFGLQVVESYGGEGGGRTHTLSEQRQILSLVRLPVPPLRRVEPLIV